jgi:hypothetical protein
MKKLLFQFDTDPIPSVFDTVVNYDGGADHVIPHGGVTPQNVIALVDGTIFTRSPKEKKDTAIFIGGTSLEAGQELSRVIKKRFFADFQVSVMLDSNGSNTTAAAGVALMAKAYPLAGKRAVVLAGTGPVGERAAVMLAREGATVSITSREYERAEHACNLMHERFKVSLTPIEAPDDDSRGRAIQGTQIVFGAGAAGVQLLREEHWRDSPTIEIMGDCNAVPPLGLQGVDMMDKAAKRHNKSVFGAIGIGALKIKLHRTCIAQLFESNKQILDAEEIYAIAKTMA